MRSAYLTIVVRGHRYRFGYGLRRQTGGFELQRFSNREAARSFVRSIRPELLENMRNVRWLISKMLSVSIRSWDDASTIEQLAFFIAYRRIQVWAVPLPRPRPVPPPREPRRVERPLPPGPVLEPQRFPRRVRFQICGGEFPQLGIADLPYTLRRGGHVIGEGRTDANGDVRFEIGYGETVEIHILESVCEVKIEQGRRLAPVPADEKSWTTQHRKDFQKRMDVLGYLTGHLRTAHAQRDLETGLDSPETQQAIQNFQVDHSLHPNGDVSAALIQKLDQAVRK